MKGMQSHNLVYAFQGLHRDVGLGPLDALLLLSRRRFHLHRRTIQEPAFVSTRGPTVSRELDFYLVTVG